MLVKGAPVHKRLMGAYSVMFPNVLHPCWWCRAIMATTPSRNLLYLRNLLVRVWFGPTNIMDVTNGQVDCWEICGIVDVGIFLPILFANNRMKIGYFQSKLGGGASLYFLHIPRTLEFSQLGFGQRGRITSPLLISRVLRKTPEILRGGQK